MKCKMLQETRSFNPEYDRKAASKAKREGLDYEIPQIITRPIGHIQEHRDCWKHCVPGHMNSDPIAIPEDEECRDKVRAWMAERPKHIAKLANLLKSSPKSKYKEFREAFAVELAEVDPDHFDIGEPEDADILEEDEDD